MRKGDAVTLERANDTLYPGLRPGEILAVQLGGWCEYHGEGCCNVLRATDGKRYHVADVHLRKLPRGKLIECGWCNSTVMPAADGTCPRCESSATVPPWHS